MEVDLNGVVTVHPRFVNMTGYRQEDLMGTKGEIMLDEEGLAKMKVIAERQNGQSSAYDHRLGHRIWLLITGAPIRNLDGEVVGSVGIILTFLNAKCSSWKPTGRWRPRPMHGTVKGGC